MIDALRYGSRPLTCDVPYEILLPQGYDAGRGYPLVMALHGQGERPEVIRRNLRALHERPYIWLFPRALYPFEIRGRRRRVGYAWYTYTGDQQALREGIDLACTHLLGVVRAVTGEYPVSRSVVLGFSQGGYLAGVLGPMNPEVFQATVVVSGRIKHEFLADAPAASHGHPLCQVHGGRDENVSPAAARESVEECRKMGFSAAEYLEDPDGAHEITAPMLETIGAWLERVLP